MGALQQFMADDGSAAGALQPEDYVGARSKRKKVRRVACAIGTGVAAGVAAPVLWKNRQAEKDLVRGLRIAAGDKINAARAGLKAASASGSSKLGKAAMNSSVRAIQTGGSLRKAGALGWAGKKLGKLSRMLVTDKGTGKNGA